MYLLSLCERLGKSSEQQLQSEISYSQLLRWQIYHHPDHWRNRIKQDTPEGRSNAIKQLILGKNG